MSSGFSAFAKGLAERIGRRVRGVRTAKGWLQSDLAQVAKLPVRTIGRIERGEVDVRLSTLHRIADALGESLKNLIP